MQNDRQNLPSMEKSKMKRLSKQEIEQIQQDFEKGKSVGDIAKERNLYYTTVNYHVNPEYREKDKQRKRKKYEQMSPQEKKELFEKRREYQKEYHRKRRELKGGKNK